MQNLPNRSAEFTFLRTRRKPVAAIVEPRATTAALSRVKAAKEKVRPVRRPMGENLPKLKSPIVRNNVELSLKHPVVRLDNRQSAVGSIVIKGAQAFAWEDSTFLAGIQVRHGIGNSKIDPPLYGNRPLIGFVDEDIVVSLLHGKHIRRIVVASSTDDIYLNFYDGLQIFVPMNHGENALVMYRVGQEFELRLEHIQTTDLLGAFGIIPSQVSR